MACSVESMNLLISDEAEKSNALKGIIWNNEIVKKFKE